MGTVLLFRGNEEYRFDDFFRKENGVKLYLHAVEQKNRPLVSAQGLIGMLSSTSAKL